MMKKLITSFCFILCVSSAYAEPEKPQLTIPDFDTIENLNLWNSSIFINPCQDFKDTGYDDTEENKKIFEQSRGIYPPHACDEAQLKEKIVKVRFLQYTLLDTVGDPLKFDHVKEEQDKQIKDCKDLVCLDKTLDSIIDKLSPIYLSYGDGFDDADNTPLALCIDNTDYSKNKSITKKTDDIIKKLSTRNESFDNCFEAGKNATSDEDEVPLDDVNFNVCKANIGTIFYGECTINLHSNQVNTKTWIFLLQPTQKHHIKNLSTQPKQIFYSDNGPIYEQNKSCNGMPTLVTNARYNAGEHLMTYYYYDGEQYKNVFSYMSTWVGKDANDNDISLAVNIKKPKTPVHCREEK